MIEYVYVVEQGENDLSSIVDVFSTPEAAMAEYPVSEDIELKFIKRPGGWVSYNNGVWYNGLKGEHAVTVSRFPVRMS